MIDINLIPVASRKKSSGLSGLSIGISSDVLFAVGGGVLAILILIHSGLFLLMGIKGLILVGHKAAWEKVLPTKKSIDTIGNEIKEKKKKINTLRDALTPSTQRWAYRLNVISDSISKGVWLKRLTVDKNALVMEGRVISRNQSDMSIASVFVFNLKHNAEFMKDFASVEINSIQKEKKGTVDVSSFIVSAKIK